MAEFCSQPCLELGVRASNSRLPSELWAAQATPLAPISLLVLVVYPKSGEAKVKSFYLFMWQQAQSLCLKNVLGSDNAALEMLLSVRNRLEAMPSPRSHCADSAPVSRDRQGDSNASMWLTFFYHLASEECRTVKAGVWIWLWRTGQMEIDLWDWYFPI